MAEKKMVKGKAVKAAKGKNVVVKQETGADNSVKADKSVEAFDPYQIIKFPLSTEKAIKAIEFDNKLTFIVDPRSTKAGVKWAVEEMFKVSVIKVNIQNAISGQKKASVKLSAGNLASDVSADLGFI